MKRLVINEIEGESGVARKIREKMLDVLLQNWNKIDALQGRHSFADDDDYDPMGEFIEQAIEQAGDELLSSGVSIDDEEAFEKCAREAEARAREEWKEEQRRPLIEKDLIEQQIHALGARFARPYEHWNEEEKMIEYLETRYDNR